VSPVPKGPVLQPHCVESAAYVGAGGRDEEVALSDLAELGGHKVRQHRLDSDAFSAVLLLERPREEVHKTL